MTSMKRRYNWLGMAVVSGLLLLEARPVIAENGARCHVCLPCDMCYDPAVGCVWCSDPPWIYHWPPGGNNPATEPTDETVAADVWVINLCTSPGTPAPDIIVSHMDVIDNCTMHRTFIIIASACFLNDSVPEIVDYTWDLPLPTCAIDLTSQAICNGGSATFTANGSGGSGSDYTYTWTKDGLAIAGNPNPLIINNAGTLDTATYACTVTDGNGCQSVNPCSGNLAVVKLGTISAPCPNAGAGQTVMLSLPVQPPGRTIVWKFNGVVATGTGTSGSSIYHLFSDNGTVTVNASDSELADACPATPTSVYVSGKCGTPIAPSVTYEGHSGIPAGYGCSCDVTFGCLYPTKIDICPIACYHSTYWQMEASCLKLTYSQSICPGANVPCAQAALDIGVGEFTDVLTTEYYNMSADIEAGKVPFDCNSASTDSQVVGGNDFTAYATDIQAALLKNFNDAFWFGITQFEPNADMTDYYNGCVSP